MFNVKLPSTKNRQASLAVLHSRKKQITSACQVLTRVDRTIGNSRHLLVRPDDGQLGSSPSAIDDEQVVHINFAHPVFQNTEGSRAFAFLLGINYHELAHWLYTPRVASKMRYEDISKWIYYEAKNAGIAQVAFNIMEDGRIERLLTGEYGASRHFLHHAYMMMSQVKGFDAESLWLITAVRANELPLQIVDKVRQAVENTDPKSRMYTDAQIDEMLVHGKAYSKLILNNGSASKQAVVHLKFLYELLAKHSAPHTLDNSHDGKDCSAGSRPNPTKQTTASKKRIVQEKKESSEEDETDTNDESSESDSEDSNSQGDEQETDDEDTDGGGSAGGQESDEDFDDDDASDGNGHGDSGEEDEDEENDDSTKKGSSSTSAGDYDDVSDPTDVDFFDDDIDNNLDNETVQNELNSVNRAMRNGVSFAPSLNKTNPTSIGVVTPQMRNTAKKVGGRFSRLVSDLDPGWNKRTSSGKLNVQRFMREGELDSAFDSWNEDRSDAADLEVLLLLDMSFSMSVCYSRPNSLPYVSAASAMWVVREALRNIEAKVSGYGFSIDPYRLFDREDNNSRSKFSVWKPSGGTNIIPVLNQTLPLMQRSKSKSKLVVVLTDGEFDDPKQSVIDCLDEFRQTGCHLVQFKILYPSDAGYDYMFDQVSNINDPVEMIMPVQEIVKQLIKKKAGR